VTAGTSIPAPSSNTTHDAMPPCALSQSGHIANLSHDHALAKAPLLLLYTRKTSYHSIAKHPKVMSTGGRLRVAPWYLRMHWAIGHVILAPQVVQSIGVIVVTTALDSSTKTQISRGRVEKVDDVPLRSDLEAVTTEGDFRSLFSLQDWAWRFKHVT